MKDKKAGVQTMPCVVFALRASNASKAKSNKTNNNFKPMSNSIKFPLSGVEKYLFNKKTKFVVDPSLPEIIFHSEDNFSFFSALPATKTTPIAARLAEQLFQMCSASRQTTEKMSFHPQVGTYHTNFWHNWHAKCLKCIFDKFIHFKFFIMHYAIFLIWPTLMWLLSTFELQYLGNPPPSQSNISNWRQKLGSECLKLQATNCFF